LEDTLKAFIQITGQSINDVKNATMVNTQAIAKMVPFNAMVKLGDVMQARIHSM